MLRLADECRRKIFKPLDEVTVLADDIGTLTVVDGLGREYARVPSAAALTFTVGGALGRHRVSMMDETGKVVGELCFNVDCQTGIEGDEFYERLLAMLHFTMVHSNEMGSVFYRGKVYHYFVCWLRDHTHVLKAMKYFAGDGLKSGLELYRDSQRADGMIWDNIYPREKDLSYFEQIFRPGDFFMATEDGRFEFRRIPVEADVEYLYVQGIYDTWRATGDDDWLASMLDSAIKALEYDLTSPYRWSKKYGLIKRGFTIDTWDFQSWLDVQRSGHIMTVDLDRTEFGVMHGDNTGFAQSCRLLALMLRRVGRAGEAEKYERLADEIKHRLDRVAWNGRFYTHHVPENEDVDRSALGGDLANQMSLSNAYALNRGLTHDQCVAIIREYQRIKGELPPGAPGEWYAIYPPFEKFNDDHSGKWEYMNGGVVTIVAGELARGAFEHGFEDYALDILDRIAALAEKHDGYLHCTYKGSLPPRPPTEFTTVDLAPYCNADFFAELGVEEAPTSARAYDYELRQRPIGRIEFGGVPFLVTDPAANGGKGCLALSNTGPHHYESVTIPIGTRARSFYLLHVMSGASPCGLMTVEYADGSRHHRYFSEHREVVRWYQPERHDFYGADRAPGLKIVWQGKNAVCERVGIGAFAFDNPHPEKEIARLVLTRMENGSAWYILALTLADQPAYLLPSDVSFGIPDNWGAAAVTYALLEGLAGVTDEAAAFEAVRLAPRWAYSRADEVAVTVRYSASQGYVAYRYRLDRERARLHLRLTGSGGAFSCHCLLPKGCGGVAGITLDGKEIPFVTTRIEDSRYVDFALAGPGPHEVVIRLA